MNAKEYKKAQNSTSHDQKRIKKKEVCEALPNNIEHDTKVGEYSWVKKNERKKKHRHGNIKAKINLRL